MKEQHWLKFVLVVTLSLSLFDLPRGGPPAA